MPGLIALRGLCCGALLWLLLCLAPAKEPLRWPLAALAFALTRHRLQMRPETPCCLLFLALFVLCKGLVAHDAAASAAEARPARGGKEGPLKPALLSSSAARWCRHCWAPQVLAMYACVVLAANTHFGVLPWVGLAAAALLSEGLFDGLSPWQDPGDTPHPSVSTRMTALLRALPVAALPLLSPQPWAGVAYILHHAPSRYVKELHNPEHQPLLADWREAFGGPNSNNSSARRWLAVYVPLCIIVPICWTRVPRVQRPAGLRDPLIVLPVHMLLTALSFERSRNLVYSVYWMAAMVMGRQGALQCGLQQQQGQGQKQGQGQGQKQQGQKQGQRQEQRRQQRGSQALPWVPFALAAVQLCAALALLLLQAQKPCWEMRIHNWPVRSAAFVLEARPQANVYHTVTYGNYLAYWLPGYAIFAGGLQGTGFRVQGLGTLYMVRGLGCRAWGPFLGFVVWDG